MVVYSNLVNIFAALGDSTRLQILAQLEFGPKTCSELVDNFDLTQQAVSKHIGILNKAGLIIQTKQGRSRFCELVPSSLEEALKWIEKKTNVSKIVPKPIFAFGSVAIIQQEGVTRTYHSTSYQ